MKKMYVTNAVLLSIVFILCLAGCGRQSTQTHTASEHVPSRTAAPDGDMTPQMDMGFYSMDPKEIQKKLKSYPNKYFSEDEARKRKLVLHSLENFKQMREIWEDFVAHFHKCQKDHSDFQQSILVVSYTVEGDAIYTYLYHHNGSLFVYEDGSRDAYGDGSPYYFQTNKVTLKKYTEDKRNFAEYKVGKGEKCLYFTWQLSD